MPSSTSQTIVLPGDHISSPDLPNSSNPKLPLKLGPGLRYVSQIEIAPTLAGPLHKDNKRNAVWIGSDSGRYIPTAGDPIIAVIHHSSAEAFHCSITPNTPHATLPHLAFENVSKKTRPQLLAGSLVYAKILSASKHLDPEILCYNASTGKSEGMGELKGGMLFDVSLAMARRLLAGESGQVCLLEEFAERLAFEVAVGRNGLVWINSPSTRETLLIGNALQETDKQGLTIEEQKKLARKHLKAL